jgi:hypothetical protein
MMAVPNACRCAARKLQRGRQGSGHRAQQLVRGQRFVLENASDVVQRGQLFDPLTELMKGAGLISLQSADAARVFDHPHDLNGRVAEQRCGQARPEGLPVLADIPLLDLIVRPRAGEQLVEVYVGRDVVWMRESPKGHAPQLGFGVPEHVLQSRIAAQGVAVATDHRDAQCAAFEDLLVLGEVGVALRDADCLAGHERILPQNPPRLYSRLSR